ncbi:hypothetical protein CBR_g38647 [Chara braunii]|uniref:Myb-like domain-containing protein n=1 Tax=Chara braunii TaxID=69332 RepID=A0A388K0J2_CHABU|nr:hypothetical protein CBR_g38647 [Chara braunii]|eukprot:GBG63581.1 hypothetical protein CBR_g38647 [Chara braunii]
MESCDARNGCPGYPHRFESSPTWHEFRERALAKTNGDQQKQVGAQSLSEGEEETRRGEEEEDEGTVPLAGKKDRESVEMEGGDGEESGMMRSAAAGGRHPGAVSQIHEEANGCPIAKNSSAGMNEEEEAAGGVRGGRDEEEETVQGKEYREEDGTERVGTHGGGRPAENASCWSELVRPERGVHAWGTKRSGRTGRAEVSVERWKKTKMQSREQRMRRRRVAVASEKGTRGRNGHGLSGGSGERPEALAANYRALSQTREEATWGTRLGDEAQRANRDNREYKVGKNIGGERNEAEDGQQTNREGGGHEGKKQSADDQRAESLHRCRLWGKSYEELLQSDGGPDGAGQLSSGMHGVHGMQPSWGYSDGTTSGDDDLFTPPASELPTQQLSTPSVCNITSACNTMMGGHTPLTPRSLLGEGTHVGVDAVFTSVAQYMTPNMPAGFQNAQSRGPLPSPGGSGDDDEASEPSNGGGKKGRGSGWDRSLLIALIEAKRLEAIDPEAHKLALIEAKRLEAIDPEARKLDGGPLKWEVVARAVMRISGRATDKTAASCKKKWNELTSKYRQILDSNLRSGKPKYWEMTPAERKNAKHAEGRTKDILL